MRRKIDEEHRVLARFRVLVLFAVRFDIAMCEPLGQHPRADGSGVLSKSAEWNFTAFMTLFTLLALVDLREATATVKRTPKEAPVCTCPGVQLVDHGASTSTSWMMQSTPAPSHERLARALIREIKRGRLDAGALLPGSRVLAESLGVNRKVVVAALDELCAEGWLEAVPARGTRVAFELPTLPVADVHAPRIRPHFDPGNTTDLQISDGAPDARLAPLEKIARAQRSALNKLSRGGLGYGSAAGDPLLREVLTTFVNQARGLSCNMNEVLITRGSQGALSLVALTLCRPR